MNISALLFDNVNGRLYDVSKLVSDIQVETSIFDNAGKVTFNILKLDNYTFEEGATFALTVDGVRVIKAYVFKKSLAEDNKQWKVTAYDALRYLKNEDSKVFEGLTSAQVAAVACSDLVLPFNTVSFSSYQTAAIVHDAKSYYTMIKRALDETLVHTKRFFIVRDNFGVIEHVNVLDLRAPFFVADSSNIVKYTYETSIDSDTYNQIKLYRDNDETEKRDIFIVNDTAVNGGANIAKWGILQYYDKVDESLNTAQVEELAFAMLSLYNNTKKELKLSEVLGFLPMAAGYVFPCRIDAIGVNNWLLCTGCTHKFEGDIHTMNLTAEVVNSEWG